MFQAVCSIPLSLSAVYECINVVQSIMIDKLYNSSEHRLLFAKEWRLQDKKVNVSCDVLCVGILPSTALHLLQPTQPVSRPGVMRVSCKQEWGAHSQLGLLCQPPSPVSLLTPLAGQGRRCGGEVWGQHPSAQWPGGELAATLSCHIQTKPAPQPAPLSPATIPHPTGQSTQHSGRDTRVTLTPSSLLADWAGQLW